MMSRPTTPNDGPTMNEAMETELTTQDVAGPSEAPAAKSKKAKAPDTLVREPGKSVLPYSRVQKILKADKDLVMVQREATFLISRATEEFIGRFAEAVQRLAERERRTTVQAKDVVATVRRAEEFAFLEELFPWSELDQGAKRKPKALQDTEQRKGAPTMLEQFVSRTANNETQESFDDDAGAQMDFVENEDGTMSMVPAQKEDAS
ncbi:hypothetical protein C8Q79DRAFT_952830 [Trametes meyenii]|nr:hypothetical protein C8Q79DRAFT_952830 [Trametes meyenii]